MIRVSVSDRVGSSVQGGCSRRAGPTVIRGVRTAVAGALLGAGIANAAETLLLNDSAAQQCYLAALSGADARDVEICNVALEHQSLRKTDFAATLSNRGLLLTRSQRFDDALADHDRAIAMTPEIPSLYINRSNTYTRAKRYDDAMRDLDRAIQLAEQARATAERAVAAAPPADADPTAMPVPVLPGGRELAAAHYNRALLYQRQGNLDAALADAKRASALMPERSGYQAYIQELERLRAPEAAPQG